VYAREHKLRRHEVGSGLIKGYVEGEYEPGIDTTLTPPGVQHRASRRKETGLDMQYLQPWGKSLQRLMYHS
jgi:hypothetical protein